MNSKIVRFSPHLPTSDVRKMVDFYVSLGFTLTADLAIRDNRPVFASLALADFQLRIELWNLPDWDDLKKGFSVTTLWFETESIESIAQRLRSQNIPFESPSVEDYGSTEIELFDPEGFRVIFSQS